MSHPVTPVTASLSGSQIAAPTEAKSESRQFVHRAVEAAEGGASSSLSLEAVAETGAKSKKRKAKKRKKASLKTEAISEKRDRMSLQVAPGPVETSSAPVISERRAAEGAVHLAKEETKTLQESYWYSQCLKSRPELAEAKYCCFFPPGMAFRAHLKRESINDVELFYVSKEQNYNDMFNHYESCVKTSEILKKILCGADDKVIVFSEFLLEKYLEDIPSPWTFKVADKAARGNDLGFYFPRAIDQRGHAVRGVISFLIISKVKGIVMINVSSTGKREGDFITGPDSIALSTGDSVFNKVKKAVKFMVERYLPYIKCICSDLPVQVKVSMSLVFSKINRTRLEQMVGDDVDTQKILCQFVPVETDNYKDALDYMLFSDIFSDINLASEQQSSAAWQHINGWWKRITESSQGDMLDDNVFNQLVARFCGSSTAIANNVFPVVELSIKSRPDMVTQIGRWFSVQMWSAEQKMIWDREGNNQRVCIQGAEELRSETLMAIKAKQWISQGYCVHVVSLSAHSHLVSSSFYYQLKSSIKRPADAERVSSMLVQEATISATELVSRLRACESDVLEQEAEGEGGESTVAATMELSGERSGTLSEPGQPIKHGLIFLYPPPWGSELLQRLETIMPDIECWIASTQDLSQRLPSYAHVSLTVESTGCPPVVIEKLNALRALSRKSSTFVDVRQYMGPQIRQEPAIKSVCHENHRSNHVWECRQCGELVAQYLKNELLVTADSTATTRNENRLSFSDIVITGNIDIGRHQDSAFVNALTQGSIPVQCLPDCQPEHLFAGSGGGYKMKDVVQIAPAHYLTGIKRSVVVVLGGADTLSIPLSDDYIEKRCQAISVCSSQLVLVGENDEAVGPFWQPEFMEVQLVGDDKVTKKRDYFHHAVLKIISEINKKYSGKPFILTGSRAFWVQIENLWGLKDEPDILTHIMGQESQNRPKYINSLVLKSCFECRDTDLILHDHHEDIAARCDAIRNGLTAYIEDYFKEQAKTVKMYVSSPDEEVNIRGEVYAMSRISLYEETEDPKPNIHYVIDVLANKKGDGSCAVDATEFECEEDLSCYCRSIKDIILGEIHIIESRGSGVDRILKAFARLYLLAELELIEKKLDPESRCLLLRALKSMKGVDEMISRLMGDEESVVESMTVSEISTSERQAVAMMASVSKPMPSTSASADV